MTETRKRFYVGTMRISHGGAGSGGLAHILVRCTHVEAVKAIEDQDFEYLLGPFRTRAGALFKLEHPDDVHSVAHAERAAIAERNDDLIEE